MGHQVRMRTSNHSRLKDIALTRILKILSLQCSALNMTCAVRCRKPFPTERSQPTFVLFSSEEQYPISGLVLAFFLVDNLFSICRVIIPKKRKFPGEYTMQVLHTTVKIERSTESKSHLRSLLNCIVSKPKLKLHMA